jgi:hypothetical protein
VSRQRDGGTWVALQPGTLFTVNKIKTRAQRRPTAVAETARRIFASGRSLSLSSSISAGQVPFIVLVVNCSAFDPPRFHGASKYD